jgi:hypothetical protein
LADPVVAAIFQDANVSGLATKSLANAVLDDLGRPPIAKVLSVTPQRVHASEGKDQRFYILDVEAITIEDEYILLEFQLSAFPSMTDRNLVYCLNNLTVNAKRGDDLEIVLRHMPRVVSINFLDYVVRRSSLNFHQLAGLFYIELPMEWATETIEIHQIQLPLFRDLKPDFSNRLHCWLTAMCRAHYGHKSLKEVVEMDGNLKEFFKADPGFAEYVERFGIVSADQDTIKNYQRWLIDKVTLYDAFATVRDEGIVEGEAKGEAKGRAEGIAEGIAKSLYNVAVVTFQQMKPGENVKEKMELLKSFGASEDIIQSAMERVGIEVA